MSRSFHIKYSIPYETVHKFILIESKNKTIYIHIKRSSVCVALSSTKAHHKNSTLLKKKYNQCCVKLPVILKEKYVNSGKF